MLGEVDQESAGEFEAGALGVMVDVLEGGGEFMVAEGTCMGAGCEVGVLDTAPFAIGGGEDVVGAQEAGDFGGGGGFGDLAGRAGLDDVTFAQDEHMMAEGIAFVEVVGD